MKWRILLVLTVIATMSSCIFTFHPLYSDDVLVDIPGLESTFIDDEDFIQPSSEWTFTRESKGTYKLKITEPNCSGTMDVHAVKLGGEYFLDFSVAEADSKGHSLNSSNGTSCRCTVLQRFMYLMIASK